MTQGPADRDVVTTSTTSTTQLNASERAAGDAHVPRGSAFPGRTVCSVLTLAA